MVNFRAYRLGVKYRRRIVYSENFHSIGWEDLVNKDTQENSFFNLEKPSTGKEIFVYLQVDVTANSLCMMQNLMPGNIVLILVPLIHFAKLISCTYDFQSATHIYSTLLGFKDR